MRIAEDEFSQRRGPIFAKATAGKKTFVQFLLINGLKSTQTDTQYRVFFY